jgi:hypothetical protein
MIEHVSYDAGLRLLGETRRVLSQGVALRIATPNLDVIRLLPDSYDPEVEEYVRCSNRTFGSPAARAETSNPVHALNLIMRSWGHTYKCDEATLRHALGRAGLCRIVRCEPAESEHADLVDVVRHAKAVGDKYNRLESLILEATD